jgi:acyl-CoA reductase-like NAD-dependent aldehyde dehydrogenase
LTNRPVVIKSSVLTPLSVLYFDKLIQETGLPADVVNSVKIVSGLGNVAGAAFGGVKQTSFGREKGPVPWTYTPTPRPSR